MLSTTLFSIVERELPCSYTIRCNNAEQYCWQHWTMWAAQHCSRLFSSTLNRLCVFTCVAVSHRRRCMTLLWHLLPNGNQLLIWNCRILGCLNWKWTHWPSFWCEIFHWSQSAKQPFQKCFRFPHWSRETFYLIASFRMSNLPFFESGSFIMHLK